jgi:addiction module HigA family antidote
LYTRERRPRHPGVVLERYYLKSRGISITRFAAATGLTRKHISNIIHGKADLSPETAVRFALVLGTSPEFWNSLQAAVQLYDARNKLTGDQPSAVEVGAFAIRSEADEAA